MPEKQLILSLSNIVIGYNFCCAHWDFASAFILVLGWDSLKVGKTDEEK
jgi:hypothetical protein